MGVREKDVGRPILAPSEFRQFVQMGVGQQDQEYRGQHTPHGQKTPAGLHRQQRERAIANGEQCRPQGRKLSAKNCSPHELPHAVAARFFRSLFTLSLPGVHVKLRT